MESENTDGRRHLVERLFKHVGLIISGEEKKTVMFEGRRIGSVSKNEYGLWVSLIRDGHPRFYGGPMAAAIDICMLWIFQNPARLLEPIWDKASDIDAIDSIMNSFRH